ncbi:odorant receptor 22c-like [Planococcus citri]|uniref:odorant receptor 22c-like n=1 Tax=Planococcus citri TaxID=170843 RepID=UPI0031F8C8C9
MSYITDFTTFISRGYTSVFYWYISSTIVFAYSFLQVIDDVIFFFKTLSMVIHGTLALYLFCHSAQVVNHMNESIQDAFYYTEWYYLPPKIRKIMIAVMMQCQRKHQIRTFTMFVVNLNLFIRSLRIVYSLLNVVLVAQKK